MKFHFFFILFSLLWPQMRVCRLKWFQRKRKRSINFSLDCTRENVFFSCLSELQSGKKSQNFCENCCNLCRSEGLHQCTECTKGPIFSSFSDLYFSCCTSVEQLCIINKTEALLDLPTLCYIAKGWFLGLCTLPVSSRSNRSKRWTFFTSDHRPLTGWRQSLPVENTGKVHVA